MRRTLLLLLPLAACAPTVRPPTPPPAPAAPATAVDRPTAPLVGLDAAQLFARLGSPALDAREGPARRVQFRGGACVLDAYLYPPAGGGAARVTWVDARTPAGADTDRAACIAALARR